MPAMTPKPTPRIASKSSAITASLMVMGKAPAITSATGRPEKVVPKSRVKTPLRYSRYCMYKGLSRLYSARIRACTSGLRPRSPPRAATGSPGIRYTIAKIRNVAPKKTGMIWRSRRPIYRDIGYFLRGGQDMLAPLIAQNRVHVCYRITELTPRDRFGHSPFAVRPANVECSTSCKLHAKICKLRLVSVSLILLVLGAESTLERHSRHFCTV